LAQRKGGARLTGEMRAGRAFQANPQTTSKTRASERSCAPRPDAQLGSHAMTNVPGSRGPGEGVSPSSPARRGDPFPAEHRTTRRKRLGLRGQASPRESERERRALIGEEKQRDPALSLAEIEPRAAGRRRGCPRRSQAQAGGAHPVRGALDAIARQLKTRSNAAPTSPLAFAARQQRRTIRSGDLR
jgi:hypothetical protein